MAARSYGQYFGLTAAVELIGERWALLIVRDLLVGPRRYTDLKQGLARIPTNILAVRLKELQAGGVVRRVPIVHRGPIYELTDFGRALEPVVLGLERWGFTAVGEPVAGDEITADALTVTLRAAFRADAAAPLPPTVYEMRVADVVLRIAVDGDALRIHRLSPPLTPVGGALPEGEPDVLFTAGPGIRRLLTGELTPAQAIHAGVLEVVSGDGGLLERFAATFRIAPGF